VHPDAGKVAASREMAQPTPPVDPSHRRSSAGEPLDYHFLRWIWQNLHRFAPGADDRMADAYERETRLAYPYTEEEDPEATEVDTPSPADEDEEGELVEAISRIRKEEVAAQVVAKPQGGGDELQQCLQEIDAKLKREGLLPLSEMLLGPVVPSLLAQNGLVGQDTYRTMLLQCFSALECYQGLYYGSALIGMGEEEDTRALRANDPLWKERLELCLRWTLGLPVARPEEGTTCRAQINGLRTSYEAVSVLRPGTIYGVELVQDADGTHWQYRGVEDLYTSDAVWNESRIARCVSSGGGDGGMVVGCFAYATEEEAKAAQAKRVAPQPAMAP
jgi:hypothetical protein